MSKAIGMAEFKTVSAGITAADAMVKTADVDVIEAETVCPGKYIVIITGELSAVNASVETAKTLHGLHLIDSLCSVIPRKRFSLQFTELLMSRSYRASASSRRTMLRRSLSPPMKRRRRRKFRSWKFVLRAVCAERAISCSPVKLPPWKRPSNVPAPLFSREECSWTAP